MTDTPEKSSRLRNAVPFLIVFLAFLAHGRSLTYSFVFDEQLLIVDNPAARGLSRPDLIFLHKFWPGPSRGIYYRPLVTLSYALGNAAAPASPPVQHAINIFLHAGAALLLFYLLRRLAAGPAAPLAALFFAAYPVHTEPVDWVPGRTDVMAAFFVFAAWIMLLKARERPGQPRALSLAASLILYLSALGAKESAIVLPALILVYDVTTLGASAQKRWREYALLVAATLAFLVLRAWVLREPGPDPAPNALAGLSPGGKLQAMAAMFSRYLVIIFFPPPWRSDFFHGETILAAPAWKAAGGAVLLAAFAAFALHGVRRKNLAGFAAAAIVISLLPVSHLIGFPTLFAERFLYLGSAFASLLIALLLIRLPRRRAPAAAVLIALFLALSVARSAPLSGPLSYWTEMARHSPGLPLAHNWLGLAYRDRGDYDRALAEYSRAYALDPEFTVARMNMAEIYLLRRDPLQAAGILEELARSRPDPLVLANLGRVYAAMGRGHDAVAAWNRALAGNPDDVEVLLLLAGFYLQSARDPGRAGLYLEAARKIDPGHPGLRSLENRGD